MADTEQPLHYYVCLYTEKSVIQESAIGNSNTSLNHSGQALDCSWASAGCSKEVLLVSLVTYIVFKLWSELKYYQ